jgi:hypothetical protein
MGSDRKPTDRLKALAEAFQALTYREMTELSEVLSESLQAQNGLAVKPAVFAEVLDSFGAFLEIEVGTGQ